MEVTSTEIQNNFGTYLKLAQVEDVYVTRNGRRIAVLSYCEDNGLDYPEAAEGRAEYLKKRPKMSLEEFLKLSETSENRYELIDGEVYLLASPTYEHQRIVVEILNQFYQWSQGKKCKPVVAPFDVKLLRDGEINIVQPDIIVICDPENMDSKGKYKGTPVLTVEVLSESTRSKDMITKLNLYRNTGVGEYWMINPANKEIYIYIFESGDIKDYRVFKGNDIAESGVCENLLIPLRQVFYVESG